MSDTLPTSLRERLSCHLGAVALVLALAALLLSVVAMVLAPTPADAASARLKDNPVASGDMVLLGDLFDGVPDKVAATPIARAPGPGNSLSFDSRALAQRARSLGVLWVPPAGLHRVAVAGLHQQTDDGLLQPASDTAPAPAAAASDGSVPMLARAIPAGEVIASSDIVMGTASGRPAADTLYGLEQIIGQAARRPLAAGRPVRASDIQPPLAVKKGEAVTMLYAVGQVRLSARGRALADAALGQPVRVLNTQSNKTVDAIASGAGEATVAAMTAPTQSASLARGAY